MIRLFFITIAALILAACAPCDRSSLPHVLVIGDSISLGYTPWVQKYLGNETIVTHCEGYASYTADTLEKVDSYLAAYPHPAVIA